MLLVLTLIGVSSMNTAVQELKMAGSMQQQNVALNRAEEVLQVAEAGTDTIVNTASAFDFGVAGDGFYLSADDINVHDVNWDEQNLSSVKPDALVNDVYVTEYLGPKPIPGESIKVAADGRITGGAVHTFRNTSRSESGKSAVRLVQSIYVTEDAP